MLKNTDLEKIKEIAYFLLELDITETEIPFLITHPIFENNPTYSNGDWLDLNNVSQRKRATKEMKCRIKEQNLMGVFLIIRKPYRMVFLKLAKEYMSTRDFSKLWAEAWVMSENPNDDVNVSLKESVDFFKEANKLYLMEKEELEVFETIPKEIVLYRGVAKGRNPKGLSWTSDYEKAKWFSNRFHKGEGYIQKAIVNKKYVLAYFSRRDAEEYVCETYKLIVKKI